MKYVHHFSAWLIVDFWKMVFPVPLYHVFTAIASFY